MVFVYEFIMPFELFTLAHELKMVNRSWFSSHFLERNHFRLNLAYKTQIIRIVRLNCSTFTLV
jgi:hypothetical protein